MQIPRFFLLLSALLLVVAIVNINADQEVETQTVTNTGVEAQTDSDTDVEDRNPAFFVAVSIIGSAFKWAKKHCVEQAARNCKQHWKHAHALRDCARGYLHSNRC